MRRGSLALWVKLRRPASWWRRGRGGSRGGRARCARRRGRQCAGGQGENLGSWCGDRGSVPPAPSRRMERCCQGTAPAPVCAGRGPPPASAPRQPRPPHPTRPS
eukprot:scaffold22080_cov125-Isochrysis_galbana.AAC.10